MFIFLFLRFCFSLIEFNQEKQIFTLETATSKYQMQIGPLGYLVHLYYGNIFPGDADYLNVNHSRSFDPNPYEIGYIRRSFSLDSLFQEYPSFGTGDFRIPCLSGVSSKGVSSIVLKYKSHTIYRNIKKPDIPGLPHATSENVDVLDIELQDSLVNISVHLFYSVFEENDIITRWNTIKNESPVETFTITKAMSTCLDFLDNDFDITTFFGKHLSERQPEKTPLRHGKIVVDSIRGASSHQQNPFLMLSKKNADEKTGIVYGVALVYSGNFAIEAEVDQVDQTRITIGINPNQFRFLLKPGETFNTPESVMVFSNNGFGNMSRKLHRFVVNNIIQSKWKNIERPVLINSWEAAYFNFDDVKLVQIATEAAKLGIYLFVLDDGWFGHRNSDNSSLGDWYVNVNKIKCGMANLAKQINDLGMSFGLWFEPEMISEDSDLYHAHPEFVLSIPGRKPLLSRKQWVLDFTNDKVIDNIFGQMKKILDESNITYIKWDMNRHLTDIYSLELPPEQQGEVFHRYVLGVYKLLDRITTNYPNILLEGCSGGGGRFDLGMLYYSPQYWTSDDTDPIERLKIQFGTSYLYPISTMGAHVSVSPNEQTSRKTSINTRAAVAMSGTFGYELDVTKLDDANKNDIIEQIKTYKKYYNIINHGDFYRLNSPFDPNKGDHYCAWMFVNDNKTKALLNVVKILTRPTYSEIMIKLDGLDLDKYYVIPELYGYRNISGSALMKAGIIISNERKKDFKSFQFEINAV